jgi:hypothetical protein
MMTIEDYCCVYNKDNKRKIILPSGIEKLDKRSFYCLNNIEVYLPNTLNYIDEGTFVAVSHLVVHIPDGVKELKGDRAVVTYLGITVAAVMLKTWF